MRPACHSLGFTGAGSVPSREEFGFKAGADICLNKHSLSRARQKSKPSELQLIQFNMEPALTDGPSVFKAQGATLISKQVKPKRHGEKRRSCV